MNVQNNREKYVFTSFYLWIDLKVKLWNYFEVHQNFLHKGLFDFDLKKYAFDIRFDHRLHWDPIQFKQIIYYLNDCYNKNDKQNLIK
jgi:hypothetical protein